ncbi:GAF domain-containing protein [Nakamurella sp. YIM 132087]|uniref:GAF domain-containing protein n=2 Tax=Nakamurella alba TaxID=2665158 RepID=A0A7K1FRQ6_9ACTN|nr:GAF domain-containing protein [Nakamurella alba]
MQHTVRALDSISRALVRTVEGPRSLLEEIARAACEHLAAPWVLLGLCDGALLRARPRFVAVDGRGDAWEDEGRLMQTVRLELGAIRAGLSRPARSDSPWVRVPMTLEGKLVGGLVAMHGLPTAPEPGDLSVLRVLANQAAVALHTSDQYQAGLELHRRAQQLYDEATAQALDLTARTNELRRTELRLAAAHQRELLDGERHRIARELHDSVSQYVLSAGMAVEIARGEAAAVGPAASGITRELDRAKGLTQEAIQQLRDAIYALHHATSGEAPASLSDLLSELTAHYRPRLHVQVKVEGSPGDPAPLDAAADHDLARIAGEALFNIANHSSADRAVVRLRYRADQVVLTVADDGKGDPVALSRLLRLERQAVADGRHRGLANMATRAEKLGGTLAFRRARLGGVRVEVRIPLPLHRLRPPEFATDPGQILETP